MTESVLLALLAGIAGCLFAMWGSAAIGKIVPSSAIPTGAPLQVDLRVLGFCLLLSIVTGLIFGVSPAWGASKPNLREGLSQAMRDAGRSGGRRLRSALVVTQLALSLVLLAAATLMAQAFARVTQLDSGIRPKEILTFEIALSPTRYASSETTRSVFRRLLDGLEQLPGVRSAALSTGLPYRGAGTAPFEIVGRDPARPDERPQAQLVAVSPDFLNVIGLRLLKGRGLQATDDSQTPPVAVVNEAFVRRHLVGQEPLGMRLRLETPALGLEKSEPLSVEIVGVCRDGRNVSPRPNDAPSQLYLSCLQCGFRDYYACLDSAIAPESLAASARRAVRDIDKDLPVAAVQTLEAIRQRALAIPRVLTGVMTTFGMLALGLAVIGVYGLVAHSTALAAGRWGSVRPCGATRGDLLRLMLRQGMRLVTLGLALGLAGALIISWLLRGLLFGVSTLNFGNILGVGLLLLAAALLACYLPARRAARIDPMVALRHE